ncbi:MAG: cryptochrome/photolyase family protein, partial [Bacteroidota bacterium]
MKKLRLILGDQLNIQHSWFQEKCPDVGYVMMEIRQETTHVTHHVQKLVGYFSAMRQFAAELRQRGHQVIYLKINDRDNAQQLDTNLEALIQKQGIARLEYLLPDEYRLDKQLRSFCSHTHIDTAAFDTEHFYTERTELAYLFKGKKQRRMETFYRHMRRKHQILLEKGQPVGGQWNFDSENRRPWKGEVPLPPPPCSVTDCTDILVDIDRAGLRYFGQVAAHRFLWPTTQKQALEALHSFLQDALPYFGTYQDAMTTRSWYLFHARLSFTLNTKLLSPRQVVQAALTHWEAHRTQIGLAQIEGFIRQIVGWREFMRGIYWEFMPTYAEKNFFDHRAQLPSYYWTGETKMSCMHHAIKQSLAHAYAHHIQRLMVTGNFALLAGVHPDEVDMWYLGVYIDAVQWVFVISTHC